MANFETKQIRNIALMGHLGSGKTALTEAMLFAAGETDRLGKAADGNTVSDYDPEEVKRGFSISASTAPMVWRNCKINIIDTPGYLDFVGEVKQAARVADSAIIVVDGKAGVEVGTELAWDYATDAGLPKAFFVNKFDDPEARFRKVLNNLHDMFGKKVCPLTIPVVIDGDVKAFLDLVDMKGYKYMAGMKGAATPYDVPADVLEEAGEFRDMLFEAIASTSDELMEKFFEGEEISREEAVEAIHQGIIHGDIVPVICGCATNLWGISNLLDAIVESFPRHTAKKEETVIVNGEETPLTIEPTGIPAIFVFKTVADPFVGKMSFFKVMQGQIRKDTVLLNSTNGQQEKIAHIYTMKGKKQTEVDSLECGDIGMVAKLVNTNTNDTLSINGNITYAPTVFPKPFMARAVKPLAKGDEDKISQGIAKLLEEDLTLNYENDKETKQLLISGLGEMHLTVLVAKLATRFKTGLALEEPKIAYREKITKKVQVEGKHKKQSGGHGQYGHVKITFSPGEDPGLTFTESTFGGSVPKNFHPAVEKGILDAMQKGVAGFPVVNLAADLYDGSYHDVDSNEMSFKMAASLAYKECLKLAAPVLLEPVGTLKVTVPEALVGDVMGDLNKRRGSVLGMNPAQKSGYTVLEASAPKAEMNDYTIALRAMTQGRGSYEFEVTGYEQVPGNIAAKIVEAYKKSQEA
jgi:elongation factor G